eukprot:augustus_masked-scaffold_15-processed-gene-9.50-mRNA-1 protein AED:1.00 eAED:1.00 QI:0/0/0/0/1/1/7/0/1677
MSAQDHSDLGEQEAAGISPGVRQSIERSFRRMRQEVRSEMQGEIQRLGTRMTDGLAAMGEQLMQRMLDQIQEALTPAVAQGGAQGQVRSAEGGSVTEESLPVNSREPGRLLELELKLKGYPVLESLDPASVSKFLLSFQVYEELVRERINKPEAYLQRCISIEVMLFQRNVARLSAGSLQGKQTPTVVPNSPSKVTGRSERIVVVGKVGGETRKCLGRGEVGHIIRDCCRKNSSPIKTEGALLQETAKKVRDKVFGDINIVLTKRDTPEETERKAPAIEQAKKVELEPPWLHDPGYTDYAWKAKEATNLLLEEDSNGSLSEEMDDYKTIFYDTELEVGIGENLEQEDSNEEGRMNEKLGTAMSSVEGIDRKKVDDTLNDMKVTMKAGMSPARAAPRLMSVEKKEALRKKLQLLEKNKTIERDPFSICSSAAFMVPKASGGFRMVVDFRKLNECVEIEIAIIPAVEQQISCALYLRQKSNGVEGSYQVGQWRFEDKYFNRILRVNSPRTMGELEDVLYISIWLNRSMPQLAELKEDLAKLVIRIKDELKATRGRKVNRKQRKGITLDQWWTNEYEATSQKLKERTAAAAKKNLSNYSSETNIVLTTDASKDYWSTILGLEEAGQDENDLTEMQFYPFYFLSGAYRGSSHNWGTPHKELFPIVRTIQKFRFLLDSHSLPIKLFTDHMNIAHLIKPDRSLNLSTIGRLYRWLLLIQRVPIHAIHVPTEQNKLADVLTRWGYCGEQAVQYDMDQERTVLSGSITMEHSEDTVKRARVKESKVLDQSYVDFRISFLQPDYTGDFKPIDKDILRKSQKDNHRNLTVPQKRTLVQDDAELYINKETKKLWIPRPLIAHLTWMIHISHGHLGIENMLFYVNHYELFLTEEAKRNVVKEVKKSCLHCDPRGYYRRRRISEIVHGTKVNQVIHADFLFVRNGYWLVLVEDVSRKILLVAAKRYTFDVFVKGLVRWKGENGLAKNFHLVSDRGSHFVNKVVQRFKEYFPFQHRLGVSYSPWTNGSAEVTHQALSRYVKSLTSQYLMDHDSWFLLTEVIVAYANKKPRSDLGFRTPMEIFVERQQDGTVIEVDHANEEQDNDMLIFSTEGKLREDLVEDKVREQLDGLTQILRKVDKSVISRMTFRRAAARARSNRTLVNEIQFSEGELVRVARINKFGDKMRLTWIGPFTVRNILGSNMYLLSDVFGIEKEVHSHRMVAYSGEVGEITQEIKSHVIHQAGEFEVTGFHSLRQGTEGYEVLVSWKGFDESEKSWENFKDMWKKHPVKITEFLSERMDVDQDAAYLYRLHIDEEARFVVADVRNNGEGSGAKKWTHNPGWTQQGEPVLQDCILAYGYGEWDAMMKGRYLPGKTRSQIVGKVQKLLKLQRLSEVHGLKISFRELNEFLDAEFGKTRKLIKCRKREDFIASDKRKERLTELYGNREGIGEKEILGLNKVEMFFPKDSKNARMKEEEFVFAVCLEEEKYEVKAEFDSGASITVTGIDSWGIPKQILEKCMVIETRGIRDASNSVAMMDDYVSVKLRIDVKNTTVWITVPEVKLWIVNKPQTEMVERLRGPSEKPSRIYEEIETLFPDGRYLEVFAHTNNLKPGWASLGNEFGIRRAAEAEPSVFREGSVAQVPQQFEGRAVELGREPPLEPGTSGRIAGELKILLKENLEKEERESPRMLGKD